MRLDDHTRILLLFLPPVFYTVLSPWTLAFLIGISPTPSVGMRDSCIAIRNKAMIQKKSARFVVRRADVKRSKLLTDSNFNTLSGILVILGCQRADRNPCAPIATLPDDKLTASDVNIRAR